MYKKNIANIAIIKISLTFISLTLLVLVSLLVSLYPAHATEADFYLTKLEPESVISGETYALNITLKNLGTSYATYLKSELDPEDVSPIDPVGSLKKYIGTIKEADSSLGYFGVVRQYDEINISYIIRVKENAQEGSYRVPLVLKWVGITGEKQETLLFGIDIKTVKPGVEVEKDSPEFVQPGEEFNISLTIKNTGSRQIKDISVSTETENPFAVKSSNSLFIPILRPGEERDVIFKFLSDKDADVGLYDVRFPIEYRDKSDAVFKKTEAAGIVIKGKAQLDIADLKIEPQNPKKGDEITIELRIENVGDDDAVNTKLTLESDLEGFKTAYLGELKKGDDTPAIFTLRSERTGEIANKLILTYEDDFGKHTSLEEIRFDISNNQSQDMGKIFILLLAAGVFVIYFTAKKRKG